MDLMHRIGREGSRAGMRSGTLDRADGVSLSDPCRGVVDSGLDGTPAERYDEGEPFVVGGVSWLLEVLIAAMALGRVEALKTEETELG